MKNIEMFCAQKPFQIQPNKVRTKFKRTFLLRYWVEFEQVFFIWVFLGLNSKVYRS